MDDRLIHLFRPRTLFVLSALFIVYATSIPWDFGHAPSFERAQWIPLWDPERGRLHSIPDLAQNLLLFLPFGFFGVLAFDRLRRASWIKGTAFIAILGAVLSFSVELLQTTSDTRIPSASDVVMNTAGAACGGMAAFIFMRRVEESAKRIIRRTLARQPGLLVLFAYAAAIALGALAPFIPTLDVSDLRANVRSLIDHPWGPKTLGSLLDDGLLFGALGFLAAHELPSLSKIARLRGPLAAAVVSAFAALLEAMQVFLVDHSPGLGDVATASVGAAAGVLLAYVAAKGDPRPAPSVGALTRRSPVIVLGFAVLAPAVRALSPFQLAPLEEKLAEITAWNFLPFWSLFRNVNFGTFRNVFEAGMFYVPLGYALYALGVRARTAFVLAFLLADLLEVLQIPIAGRTFDVTEGIYAGCGAMAGAYTLLALRRFQVASAEPSDGSGDPARRAQGGRHRR